MKEKIVEREKRELLFQSKLELVFIILFVIGVIGVDFFLEFFGGFFGLVILQLV